MYCERCGSEIADTAIICPQCGASLPKKVRYNAGQQPVTNYGQYLEGSASSYQKGYTAPPKTPFMYKDTRESPQLNPQVPPQPHMIKQMRYVGPPASPGLNVVRVSTKNTNALIIEIILSLFGLFGVGWLIAGETATGAVLLVCSIFIYWPIIILGTIFTFGLGLICLGPLVIGAIILNILLLNKVLERQATQYVITPQPVYMNTPPRQ